MKKELKRRLELIALSMLRQPQRRDAERKTELLSGNTVSGPRNEDGSSEIHECWPDYFNV